MAIQDYEERLIQIDKEMKKLDNEKKKIVADIKKQHTSVYGQDYGQIQVQITAPYYTLEFDQDTFKVENEELYNKYLVPTYKPSQTKVVLQIRKEKKEDVR